VLHGFLYGRYVAIAAESAEPAAHETRHETR
jgi:hypothetical protein